MKSEQKREAEVPSKDVQELVLARIQGGTTGTLSELMAQASFDLAVVRTALDGGGLNEQLQEAKVQVRRKPGAEGVTLIVEWIASSLSPEMKSL